MKITNIDKQKQKIIYTVLVDQTAWLKQQEIAISTLAKKMHIPGFRPGKVPSGVIKDKLDLVEILKEASHKTVDLTYAELVKDSAFERGKIIPNSLKVTIGKIDQQILEIQYEFELFPDIQVVDYRKLKLSYKHPHVDSKEIDQEINRMLQKDVMLIPKTNDEIVMGDMVNFDFKGYIDDKPFPGGEAKDYELEIGSNSFIPGFESQMIGLKRNQTKTINVQFPADYHAKEMANKSAKFEVKINDIKTIQKPKMDENYISKLQLPNVKNHADLQAYLHKRILERKEEQNIHGSVDEITQAIVEGSKIDFMPLSLLDSEKKRIDELVTKRASESKLTKEAYVKQHHSSAKDVSYEH
jgi:trigger factor